MSSSAGWFSSEETISEDSSLASRPDLLKMPYFLYSAFHFLTPKWEKVMILNMNLETVH